ncbi:transcriptional regulator, LysR family [Candidatus Paraburkholderia kirkii]|nr:transcriptional regulator, LysR family [Candidatus Paraburkholderia kirkii]
MDLFTLKLFLTAIEEGQIGRAAAREHIAPSAATKRIQDLEDLAGVKLFERNPKSVVPSAAGEIFARHIRLMLDNLNDMRREITEFADGVGGRVSISAVRIMIQQFLGKEISNFTRRFPLVNVVLREDSSPNAVRALVTGDVDVAMFVVDDAAGNDMIDSIEYKFDRLVAVMPLDHPASTRHALTFEDLLDLVNYRSSIMAKLRQVAQQRGRELHVKYEVTSVEAARSLVSAGLGIAVQPASMLSMEDRAQLATVSLEGDWAQRVYCIGTLHGRPLSPAVKVLIEQMTMRLTPADLNVSVDARIAP